MRRWAMLPTLLCTLLLWPMMGCSQEPRESKMDGLTGVVFNYSNEVMASVRVDGELAGTGLEAVKPGDVTGGGSSCCMSMDPTLDTVDVEIEPATGPIYTLQGTVEQPWPKGASTVIVHVLPGRKVVIEATLGVGIGARSDLMNTQLKALGIDKEIDKDWMMISERYKYTEYMEVKRP
ncbi:hypothetical protein [Luteimonas sp. A501]